MNKEITVAIVGNPNVGKTALINTLAGSHLKIGNWPGVTVEKKEAVLEYKETIIRLVDLPGVYSLSSTRQDEIITDNFLHLNKYDLIINVIDANNIELNLNLTTQLLESKKPMIMVINFWKEFIKQGNILYIKKLSKQLNIEILTAEVIDKNAKEIILESIYTISKKKIPRPITIFKKNRHEAIQLILVDVLHTTKKRIKSLTDRIDRIFLHPVLGIISFITIFYFMFKLTYDGSAPFIDWIDGFFNGFIRNNTQILLNFFKVPDVLQSFIINGLIAGVGTVMTFIPLMAFLYFFISLLEESGYISRVAYLLDKYMMMIGLPGKAFIPLLIGFGCNVPGVYATRTLEEDNDKKIVTSIMSFMSCGAKLPIYILFSSVFFPKYAGFVAISLYLLGIIIAIIWASILKKWVYPNKSESLIIELPEYHLPTTRVVWNSVRLKIGSFIHRAGTVITAVVILIWALTNLPYGAGPEKSILSNISKTVSPVFMPLGWGHSWRATASVVPGFLAKEAVIGALATTYGIKENHQSNTKSEFISDLAIQGVSLKDATIQSGKMIISGIIPGVFSWEKDNDTTLITAIKKDFTPLTAISFMIFNLLLMSCTAVMGAIKYEFGGKFLLITLAITGGTAYTISFIVFQIGRLFVL